MGLYLSTYCGPVVEAEYETIEKPTKIRKCLKCNKERNDVKFCPHCGEEVQSIAGPIKSVVFPNCQQRYDVFKASNLSDEALMQNTFLTYTPGYHIYEPNERRGSPRNFSISDPANFSLNISNIDIEEEKKWLSLAFAPEIDVLKTLYKSVQIQWVFMNYES